MPLHRVFLAIALCGIVAGVFSTAVQVALWLALTDDFPDILWRDARLAAAIVLGPSVLPPSTAAPVKVMLASTVVHFALSVVYAAIFCEVARRLEWRASLLVGALLGAALYGVNMYGFTALFPWFAATRDPITFVAHLAFGASATWSGKLAFSRLAAAGSRQSRRAIPRPEAGGQ